MKTYKPTSPGVRAKVGATFSEITKDKPEKSLLESVKRIGGRDGYGHLTVRHRGGGAKRRYRVIDFRRNKDGVPAKVTAIEYDPNRSARIALLYYADGDKRYILAPVGLSVGDQVASGPEADIRPGNALPLAAIPVGTVIHALEMKPGKGAQLCRSAGAGAQIMAKEGNKVLVRLPSGEQRYVPLGCRATVGQVGNLEHENASLGKAGASRWRGRRPAVRGVAMNPVDHPHGGGEGKAPIGRPSPVSPWGKPTMGYRTRKKKNPSNASIVKRRKK